MELSERLKKLLDVENVLGYAYVNSEDGSIIHSGGITPGNIDEIVAFIGSASDIISKTFKIFPYRVVKLEGKDNILIFRFQDNYLGCVVEELNEETRKRIEEIVTQEDLTGDPDVFRVLKGKAKQISLLLEEFTVDSDPEKWKGLVEKAIVALDRDNKFSDLVEIEGVKLVVKGARGVTKEEVNKYMKLLLDFIVKEAIKEFGSDEAKRKVHSVIEKLSGEKK